jgi:hypothetical protein
MRNVLSTIALLLVPVGAFVPHGVRTHTRLPAPSRLQASVDHAAVAVETLVLPMADDTRLKIRFSPEDFDTLAVQTNEVRSILRIPNTGCL